MAHQYTDCRFERDGAIATLTLDRTARLNALSPGIREGIMHATQEVQEDDELKVLIITGAGRAFCAGADFKPDRAKIIAGEGRKGLKGPLSLPILCIWNLDKPVIGAINGFAMGGGFGLALSCDIRIASSNAQFCNAFFRRGRSADWGLSYFLVRVLGLSRALRVLWSGRMIDAEEAERLGLVEKVVPPDELMNEARKIAKELARGPSCAIEQNKRLAHAVFDNTFFGHLTMEMCLVQSLHDTEDAEEGGRSFVEKREPVFKGR